MPRKIEVAAITEEAVELHRAHGDACVLLPLTQAPPWLSTQGSLDRIWRSDHGEQRDRRIRRIKQEEG